jgi:hypothetical protein
MFESEGLGSGFLATVSLGKMVKIATTQSPLQYLRVFLSIVKLEPFSWILRNVYWYPFVVDLVAGSALNFQCAGNIFGHYFTIHEGWDL